MTDNGNWWCRIKMLSHRSVTSKKLNQLYCSFPIEMSNSHFNKKEFNITLHRNYIVTTLMWVLELEEQRCSAEQILKIPWRAWQSPPRPQARCRCSGAWSGSCRTSPGSPPRPHPSPSSWSLKHPLVEALPSMRLWQNMSFSCKIVVEKSKLIREPVKKCGKFHAHTRVWPPKWPKMA